MIFYFHQHSANEIESPLERKVYYIVDELIGVKLPSPLGFLPPVFGHPTVHPTPRTLPQSQEIPAQLIEERC